MPSLISFNINFRICEHSMNRIEFNQLIILNFTEYKEKVPHFLPVLGKASIFKYLWYSINARYFCIYEGKMASVKWAHSKEILG